MLSEFERTLLSKNADLATTHQMGDAEKRGLDGNVVFMYMNHLAGN